jgi:tRNA modification GTPase
VIVHLGVVGAAGEGAAAAGGVGGVGVDRASDVAGPSEQARAALARDLDARIAARLPRDKPILRVWNKIDLAGTAPRATDEAVWLSARTGEGIALLRAALLRLSGWHGAGEGLFIARERHLQALRAAGRHLEAADEHAHQRAQSLDLFAEELRLAQEQLGTITGQFGADDLLGVIFSRFCIGK